MNVETIPKISGIHQWKPSLSSYPNEEISVVTFETKQDLYKAMDFVWQNGLRGMPFGIPGYNSLVIPKEAVSYFSHAGFKFEETKLLTKDDLTPEELSEFRNRRR